MGMSHKSHGKKTDKETQSPMLKIFKDIMQKEKTDPEKVTLLKEKQREKKRKFYSESKSKSNQRSYDSSSTDRYRTNKPGNIAGIPECRNENYSRDRSRSSAFRGEKRESWWFWGEKAHEEEEEKKPDDTFSCVSCALKKIIGSEYACIACLLILFSISVVVAFLLVFKTITPADGVTEKCQTKHEEGAVKNIRMLKEKRQLTETYGLDFTSKWDDSLTNSLGSYAGVLGSEFTGNRFKDSNMLNNVDAGISEDLASVLDNGKVMESQTSERLRDFFKKLIQTDAQIRKLKQIMNNNYNSEGLKAITDRFKRSLRNKKKHHNKIKSSRDKAVAKRFNLKSEVYLNKNDNKRSLKTNDSEIKGYVFEAQKILVKYEPDKKRNFPKCSHAHETKSHEKHIKHPLYKNSQRIHDILETYKNVEEITKNNNIQDILLVKNKVLKQKTKSTEMPFKTKPLDDDRILTSKEIRRYGIGNEDIRTRGHAGATKSDATRVSNDLDYNMEKFSSTAPVYDVALSVSTFMNVDRSISKSKLPQNVTPGQRKLLQIEPDEDQENLGYEDLKEVLTDDKEDHDEFDKDVERKKRNLQEIPNYLNQNKYNPPNTNNLNWKGPMPLYPDELNAMIRQAAFENLNIHLPINTKDMKPERDKDEKEISDTQYVEDYVDNKYDKMVKMAQAYSDYGVLYNKKENQSEKNKDIKFDNVSKFKIFKKKFFHRQYPPKVSEGIRFEIRPGTMNDITPSLGIVKALQKHIKIYSDGYYYSTTSHTINPEVEKLYGSTPYKNSSVDRNLNSAKSTDVGKKFVLVITKGTRSLKSVDSNVETLDKNYENLEKNVTDDSNKLNNKTVNTTDGMLNFVLMMSDWFKTMAGLSGEISNDDLKEHRKLDNNHLMTNFSSIKSTNKVLDENNTKDVLYPSYDTDMVDNIGHRSRVLMSLDNKFTDNIQKGRSDLDQKEFDNIVPVALVLANSDVFNNSKNNDNSSKLRDKTIVKRNVENKLVFWNDLYDDDEYGVKVEYSDSVRDKHSVQDVKNAMHKSSNWIQGKFRKIFHKNERKSKKKHKATTKKTTTKPLKKIEKPCTDINDSCKDFNPRPVRHVDNIEETNIKKNFETLTANMKRICKEAARQVQNTRNIEVRDNNKDGAAATSLMQRLVRMMTDLVDIQVQQKTCAKLPADLYNFLEWLTAPPDTRPYVDDSDSSLPDYVGVEDDSGRFKQSTEQDLDILKSLTEDTHQDDRTECLGTIRAIQDLIQQYEGMSDEDKSKMTGVKEYLENQLQFLNKKLNGLDEADIYKLYQKRELSREKRDADMKKRKDLKDKSKMHVKENVPASHVKNKLSDAADVRETKNRNERSLKDFYHKAIEEMKKSTAKHLRKTS